MAQLRVERLLATKLILDLSAMAIGLIQRVELVIILMNSVWGALLPLAKTRSLGTAALIFVHG